MHNGLFIEPDMSMYEVYEHRLCEVFEPDRECCSARLSMTPPAPPDMLRRREAGLSASPKHGIASVP